MKVTTVRFSDDLWTAISEEAEIAGVSASQFIREAALARAAAAAGARGELPFPSLSTTIEATHETASDEVELQAALVTLSRALAGSFRTDSQALRAQSQQARRTSKRLMEERRSQRS
jgi:hypothetical protein